MTFCMTLKFAYLERLFKRPTYMYHNNKTEIMYYHAYLTNRTLLIAATFSKESFATFSILRVLNFASCYNIYLY